MDLLTPKIVLTSVFRRGQQFRVHTCTAYRATLDMRKVRARPEAWWVTSDFGNSIRNSRTTPADSSSVH